MLQSQELGRNNTGWAVLKDKECVESTSTATCSNHSSPTEWGSLTLIDREYMESQMYCLTCDKPLLLQNILSEKMYALGVTYLVQCAEC